MCSGLIFWGGGFMSFNDTQVSGLKSSGMKDTFGRILGVAAALLMIASVLTPLVTTTLSRGRTDSAKWDVFYEGYDMAVFFSTSFVIVVSVAAIVLAIIQTKETKIAYVVCSCYSVIFGIYAISKISDFTNALNNPGQISDGPVTYRYSFKNRMEKTYGYYILIAAVVVAAVAGIYMVISLKGRGKTAAPAADYSQFEQK